MNAYRYYDRIESRAQFIQKTLGTRCAAGYLRNRGMPIAFALAALVRPVSFPSNLSLI